MPLFPQSKNLIPKRYHNGTKKGIGQIIYRSLDLKEQVLRQEEQSKGKASN
jgi:hypothetical protein